MDESGSSPADLPLPDPFPEYLTCPHCGEVEVEVWCYQTQAQCHRCGGWFDHLPYDQCKLGPACQAGARQNRWKFILLLQKDEEEPDKGSLG